MLKEKMIGKMPQKVNSKTSFHLNDNLTKLIWPGRIWMMLLIPVWLNSCDLSEIDPIESNNVNIIFVGNQAIQFVSAKLTIIGPVEVSGPDSHFWAKLELSTDIEFNEPFIANSSVVSIGIHSVYDGTPLPKFPILNGEYKVFPPTGIKDQEILKTLVGKNFSLGPSIGLNYISGQSTFNNFRDAESGIIDLSFDFSKNRVRVAHNWVTKEGTRVIGTSVVPVDISNFVP
jgi:hypothetical protein